VIRTDTKDDWYIAWEREAEIEALMADDGFMAEYHADEETAPGSALPEAA